MIFDRVRHDDVLVVTWDDGENRLRSDSVAAWHDLLDEVGADEGPIALVVTGAGRFFSNGLDLDWMTAHGDETDAVLAGVHRLFGRLLTLNCYTVAAINGHAFAAGAMLTCGFDERVMRTDRGFWCLPEIDLGLPLTPAMFATVAARLPRTTLHEAIVTGRRYGGNDALEACIVEHAVGEDRVVELAIERAQSMAAKDRRVIANHKHQMYGTAAEVCGA